MEIEIKCKATKNEHIVEEPIELPCKINICKNCYNVNQLCLNCNEKHDIKEFKINKLAVDFIKGNIKLLSRTFENENMGQIKIEGETSINRKMNDLKDQIDLRTESVKFEIEIKKNKLMEMVNNRMKMYKFYYYQNILRKLNSEYKLIFKPKEYLFEDLKDLIGEIDEFFDKQTFTEAENVAKIQEFDEIFCLTGLKNGDIITGSKDGKIKIWNLESKTFDALVGHSDAVFTILELKNGEVISGSKDKTIRVWDMKTRTCTSIITEQNSAVKHLIQLKSGQIASGCSNGKIYLWDILKKTCVAKLEGHVEFISILLQFKADQLISVSFDNKIIVWDLNTNTCLAKLEPQCGMIKSSIQSKNGNLISASNIETEGKLFIWNFQTKLYKDKTIKTPFSCLIELKSGEIMTGLTDGSIKIFEIENFSCMITLTGHKDSILCLTQLKNSQVLSGSNDRTFRLWDSNKKICIGTFKQNNPVLQIKELKNGEVITRTSKDNLIRVWKRKHSTHILI